MRALRQAGLRAAARELRRVVASPAQQGRPHRPAPRLHRRPSRGSPVVEFDPSVRVVPEPGSLGLLGLGLFVRCKRVRYSHRWTAQNGRTLDAWTATPHRAGLPTATDCRTHAGAAGTGGNLAPTPLRFVGFFYITDRPISTRETKPLFRRVGAKRHALCIESAGMGRNHCPREPTVMFGRLWRDAP